MEEEVDFTAPCNRLFDLMRGEERKLENPKQKPVKRKPVRAPFLRGFPF